jgi:predicted RNA-binding Zn-ribbon protein involved in translation (DUF1610 family)
MEEGDNFAVALLCPNCVGYCYLARDEAQSVRCEKCGHAWRYTPRQPSPTPSRTQGPVQFPCVACRAALALPGDTTQAVQCPECGHRWTYTSTADPPTFWANDGAFGRVNSVLWFAFWLGAAGATAALAYLFRNWIPLGAHVGLAVLCLGLLVHALDTLIDRGG